MEASNLVIFDAVSEINEEISVITDYLNYEGNIQLEIESDGEDVVVCLGGDVLFDSDLEMDEPMTKNEIKTKLLGLLRTEFMKVHRFIGEYLKQNP